MPHLVDVDHTLVDLARGGAGNADKVESRASARMHALFTDFRAEHPECRFRALGEVFAGPLAGLRCCALLAALRARGGGRPVVLTIRGDELSRARGGARSLVMPLVREREAR